MGVWTCACFVSFIGGDGVLCPVFVCIYIYENVYITKRDKRADEDEGMKLIDGGMMDMGNW